MLLQAFEVLRCLFGMYLKPIQRLLERLQRAELRSQIAIALKANLLLQDKWQSLSKIGLSEFITLTLERFTKPVTSLEA
jgi:hypothetical protein